MVAARIDGRHQREKVGACCRPPYLMVASSRQIPHLAWRQAKETCRLQGRSSAASSIAAARATRIDLEQIIAQTAMTESLTPVADDLPVGAGTEEVELFLHCLGRIFDSLEGRDLRVVELAANLLDLADINVLDDVTGLRINRYGTARTFPFHALHR